jgi:hypothetical protein
MEISLAEAEEAKSSKKPVAEMTMQELEQVCNKK